MTPEPRPATAEADTPICLHYDPIGRAGGCEAGKGRIAPRDCKGCSAYEPDAVLAQTEPARLPEAERTRCEIWTRVMGYHRPVEAFNAGKRAEHAERVYFREDRDARDEGGA